jgi:RHS repeat-associated protein
LEFLKTMKTACIRTVATAMAMGLCTGLQASVTEHQPPAPLPEFKTPEQLAKWRADQNQKSQPSASSQEGDVFYTGKPYLAESGSYAFKYREYNPEMNRWTTVDPSGFPDGANNYCYVNNICTIAADPTGLDFLLFNGSSLSLWSGSGHQSNGSINWGNQQWNYSSVSGGSDGAYSIPKGWWRTTASMTLAGPDVSIQIGNRSEKDYSWNGITFQGTMSIWNKSGYNLKNYSGYYQGDFLAYDPNNSNDAGIGAPTAIEYKFGLSGVYGNSHTLSEGYRLHPKGVTTTHGCIGITDYSGAATVQQYLSTHVGTDLLVE